MDLSVHFKDQRSGLPGCRGAKTHPKKRIRLVALYNSPNLKTSEWPQNCKNIFSTQSVQESDCGYIGVRGQLKRDGTRAETRFRLSAKRTSLFKMAGASVQSTAGSRGVRISGSNAGYMFRGSVKSTGYPLHSPVSPSLPLPCVTMCHQVSTGLYRK